MTKSPEIIAAIDRFAELAFQGSRSNALSTATCVICKQPAKDFTDELSLKEYNNSGMCQNCQDGFFE